MNSRVAVPGSVCLSSSYGQDYKDRESQVLSRVIVVRTEAQRGRKLSLSSPNLAKAAWEEKSVTTRKRSGKEENHHKRLSEINPCEEDKQATERILNPIAEGDTSVVGNITDIRSGRLHYHFLLARDSSWKDQPQQRLHSNSTHLITKRKWMHLKIA